MSEYVVTDTELTAVANAIRTKGGTQAALEWYSDFVSAIEAISGGGDAKIYEFIDEDYYMDSTGTICVVGGITYTKTNADPAFVAYWHKSNNYTGPVLVSETEDGAKYTVGGNTYNPSSVTIDGKSWYVSADSYYQYGDLTKSGGFAQKLSGSYASISSAAEALLALAFNNLITENGTYNVPSGYDGFGDFEVDVDPDLETLLATQNGIYTSQNKDGYSTVTVNVSGGGGITKDLIYEFNESQGGTWINTEVDVSNIDYFLFEGYLSGTKSKESLLSKNLIPVSSSSYIKIFTFTYDCNVQIRNDYLYISFGNAGSSSNVVKVYSVEMSQGGGSTNILSGTVAPTASGGSDGSIYLQYEENEGYEELPSGYTLLEYVQFVNGAYINTGIAPTNHFVEMQVKDLSYGYDKHWFGTDTSASHPHFTTFNYKYYWGTGSGEQNAGSWLSGVHKLEFNKGSSNDVIIDDTTLGSGSNISSTSNILIGRRTSTANAENLQVYYFKMRDRTDDSLVMHLVPAKDSNDVIGFYDLVSETFFTNAGTGTFISGPEINGKPIVSTYLKVDGAWQSLIGSYIDDVNTGSES